MTYQVLARKYRPERFQDVIGQDHVTQTLLNAFALDRLAHAYLFAGPRGVGKTTTARILAKALNCLKNTDGNPCDECQNCKEIATSGSMDVLEIDGASNRGIDEIRNLRELVKYPPIHAKFKIFIIDEVHMLTTQAFNALLKTLEEPPSHVKFVFATTEPNKVLPTVLSRCQRHEFHRLSENNIKKGLNSVFKNEGITIDDKTEQVITGMADGSMRDALSLLDQIIAFCGNTISFDKASSLLGIIPTSLYFDVTSTIKDKNYKQLLSLMQRIYSEGYSLNVFISGLNQHFLNILVCKVDSERELLNITEDILQLYKTECQKWETKDILRYIDLISNMESNLKIVQQPKIYVETMMLKLLEMDSTISINDLLSRISSGSLQYENTESDIKQESLFKRDSSKDIAGNTEKHDREKTKDTTVIKEKKEEVESESKSSSDLFETVQERWTEIISKISENGTSLGVFMSHGLPTALKGKKLIITFPRKYRFQIDVLKKNIRKIESIIEKTVDHFLKIEFIVGERESDKQNSTDEETHPVTKRMLELFGGEIID